MRRSPGFVIAYRALPAVALSVALLVAGCSTSVQGSPVAGASQTSPATQTTPASTTDTGGAPSTAASGPDLGSIVLPTPPPSTSTTQQDSGADRTSDQQGSTTTTTPPSSPPVTSTSPAPPVTTTVSGPSTSTSTSQPGSGTDPFAGATSVNPASFPGTVTPIGFSTPSGNISCGFQPTKTPSVVCQIDHHTYPNPSQDCHGAGAPGGAVTLSVGGPAQFLCAGDLESGGPTLAYGSMISVSGLQCVSRENGVTCRDTSTGNRFRLASGSYELVNGGKVTTASAAASTGSGLSRFVGTWGGHGRSLDFASAGRGTVTYRTYTWCSDNPNPPCDSLKGNEIVAGGKVTVTLTSASSGGTTATGSITSSNDPAYPTGTHVTATISGYDLTLSIWSNAPFCAPDTPSDQWNCGA